VKVSKLLQGFAIKTILQTNSKKIRHGFHGLSGLTPEQVIKIRVNLLNRRFSASDYLTFTNKIFIGKSCKLLFLLLFLMFSVSILFAQITENDAQKQISLKNFRQAREIYTKLSIEQPEKLVYKMWIARLSAWLLELPRSLKEYDRILRQNPTNNEALLGKVYVLMWQKKYGKAKKTLAIAEKNGRTDASFLVTKINFFKIQNKLKQARKLVKEAKQIIAGNTEVNELEKALKLAKSKTYQTGCEQSVEPFTNSTASCFASVTTQKGNDQFSAKIKAGIRFGKTYQEIGINWKRDINTKLTLIANLSVEPQKAVNTDADLSLSYKLNKRLSIVIGDRNVHLNGKNINIFSTNASIAISEKTNLQTTLYNSSSNVLFVKLSRQITKPLNMNVSWVKSFEKLKNGIPVVSQNAVVASGKYQLSKNLTISGSYGYTKKNNRIWKPIYGFGFTFTK
jgi:tetratricopeptide (TPR) repeat protein